MSGPRHHPSEERLLAYVTGETDLGLRLLLEAHLGACDRCAELVGAYSAAGGAGLRAVGGGPPPSGLFARIEAGISEAETALGNRSPFEAGGAPFPLPERIAAQLPDPARLRWRGTLKKGVRYLTLLEDPARQASLYLLHLRAGCAFPSHAHGGLEQSLVLAGGARDGGVLLEASDFREHLPGTDHHPEALPDEDCWLLTRLEGGMLRFHGWRGLLQRL